MTHLRCLPEGAALLDVFRAFPETARPLLRYVGTLTRTSRVTAADAVAVCGLFNLMNRLVDGLGVTAGADYLGLSGRRLAEGGYAGLKDLL